MARGKGKSGLDALFSKVFDDTSIKNAITSLHEDFESEQPLPPPLPSPPAESTIFSSQPVKQMTIQSDSLPSTIQPLDIPPLHNPQSAILPLDTPPSNSRLSNSDIADYSTVKQSTIPPSNIRPNDRHISHGDIYDHQTIPQDIISMSYNQAAVFDYLIRNDGVTNMRAISEATSVGIPSVKDAVSRLVRRGFMHNPVTIRTASYQGFSYILNKSAVDHFIEIGGLERTKLLPSSNRRLSHRQIEGKTKVQGSDSQPSNRPPLDGWIAHSSSSLEKVSTTTEPGLTVGQLTIPPLDNQLLVSELIRGEVFDGRTLNNRTVDYPTVEYPGTSSQSTEGFVLVGAIEAYWNEEGLQETQAQKWCKQFEVEPSQMRQQLEWARFDLEMNNRREEVKKDSISWFFGHLRKTGGCFPRPVNYKSPAELRAEALEMELAKEMEAKERLTAAEMERDFRQILSDPEGKEYQALLSKLNDFARGMTGTALETVLREEFLKSRGGVNLK